MAKREPALEGLVVKQVTAFYRGKRLLVTGATGFIGRHLVERLLQCGAQVRITVYRNRWPATQTAVESVPGDFNHSDPTYWEQACCDCDGIFHLAAAGVTAAAEPASLLQQHLAGPAAMLEAAAKVGVKAMVYTSSCFVYGLRQTPANRTATLAPVSPYAASKAAAETWLAALGRRFQMPVAYARLFHVYGPGEHPQRLIPYVLSGLHTGKQLELTTGHQQRDFLYVADAVDGLLHLGTNIADHAGTAVNLGTGRATSVRELVATAKALFTTPGDAVFGARPDRPDSLPFLVADAAETEALLGWRAQTSLEKGLAATARTLFPKTIIDHVEAQP